MQRRLLGLIALLFLAAGVGMWFFQTGDIAWVALRIGMVLAALWLALPQVTAIFSKIPRWVFPLAAVAVLVVAFTKSFLVVIPIVGGIALLQFVGWLFKPPRPRKASGASRRAREKSAG